MKAIPRSFKWHRTSCRNISKAEIDRCRQPLAPGDARIGGGRRRKSYTLLLEVYAFKELWVPILPELQVALSAASRHSVFILTNERGTNRWSYRGASQAVRNVRERIGALLGYDIHSWRYNAACELVEAGCGDDLVAAVTGQSPAMVLHYTKKVRQKYRAIQAQQKRTEQKQNV